MQKIFEKDTSEIIKGKKNNKAKKLQPISILSYRNKDKKE